VRKGDSGRGRRLTERGGKKKQGGRG